MENRINIATLLKNCPTGMELDSPMYDNLYFDRVEEDYRLPISCYTIYHGSKTAVFFTEFGNYNEHKTAKCIIFPKGKTTWEGFHRPFKDGDILFYKNKSNNVKYTFIYKRRIDMRYLLQYCGWFSEKPFLSEQFNMKERIPLYENDDIRFATEEEKARFFQAIKDNGYYWNAETKTLEKIEPKFKVGDWITDGVSKCQIHFIDDTQYWYSENCILGSIESVDKRYHLWTINDAKDGDIVSTRNGIWIGIVKKPVNCACETYITINGESLMYDNPIFCFERFATEEEKEKLFKVIKDNGYKWNPETKVLEKLTKQKFKDGDIIADEHGNIAIYKGTMWYNKKLAGYYCGYRKLDNHFLPEPKRDGHFGLIEELHHATEEEKEKLFQVIIDNGYHWNTEIKVLEKLFPYNIGTKVWVKSDKEHKYIHTIVGISYNCFGNLVEYEVKEEKTGIVVHYPKELLIPITTKKPKFKVGDTIQSKEYVEKRTIQLCEKDGYWTTVNSWIRIDDQDKWELVSDKFDITILKAFDEVLVRNADNGRWRGQFYMSYDKNEEYPFECVYNCWKQCIPYEGNEHLFNKTDDCDNYYKNWE